MQAYTCTATVHVCERLPTCTCIMVKIMLEDSYYAQKYGKGYLYFAQKKMLENTCYAKKYARKYLLR